MALNHDIMKIFRPEAEDNLTKLEDALSSLDPNDYDAEEINGLFRTAHNLKGAAHTAGCRRVGELAHVVEELLDRWRDGRLEPCRSQIDWAIASVEALRVELVTEIDGATEDDEGAGASAAGQDAMLRVSVAQLDALVDTISQIVIDRSKLEAWVERGTEPAAALRDSFEQSQRLYTDLRDRVFSMRLTPVDPLMRRLERTAMDVAKKLGKSIDVELVGTDLEVDATLIDGLKDPLNHMIRNAVDHGVEMPDVRVDRGKSPRGRVKLSARRQGGVAIFELSDDGGGLSRAKIVKKAREQGKDLDEESLTSDDLAAFIFQAGFSTAETVDDISGRGVGMDVVRQNIESLRGEVAVASEEGHGTTFTIRVPLSMAILDGFHFEAGGQVFVLPADVVEECVESSPLEVDDGAVSDVIEHRGHQISRLDLARVFGAKGRRSRRNPSLIVYDGDTRLAIGVDHVIGERQTVLEPLGPLFRDNRPIAGATVLGTGEVAVVLDIHRVIEVTRQRANAA